MQPTQIIEHIDEWLTKHGWRLAESEIDFALDVRQLVAELEHEQSRQPVLTNA